LLHDFLSPSLSLRLSSGSLAVGAFSLESCAAGSKQAKSKLRLLLGWLAASGGKRRGGGAGLSPPENAGEVQPFYSGSQTASRAT